MAKDDSVSDPNGAGGTGESGRQGRDRIATPGGQSKLRDQLERDVQAFLASGKKIQQIPTGVSGGDFSKGPKHIVLNRKPNRRSKPRV